MLHKYGPLPGGSSVLHILLSKIPVTVGNRFDRMKLAKLLANHFLKIFHHRLAPLLLVKDNKKICLRNKETFSKIIADLWYTIL